MNQINLLEKAIRQEVIDSNDGSRYLGKKLALGPRSRQLFVCRVCSTIGDIFLRRLGIPIKNVTSGERRQRCKYGSRPRNCVNRKGLRVGDALPARERPSAASDCFVTTRHDSISINQRPIELNTPRGSGEQTGRIRFLQLRNPKKCARSGALCANRNPPSSRRSASEAIVAIVCASANNRLLSPFIFCQEKVNVLRRTSQAKA
uniref:Uncharacterized protein n=1 Tax=Steinernema glaseri TaxID=37863 RepID=A0A1I7YKG8_9BILA